MSDRSANPLIGESGGDIELGNLESGDRVPVDVINRTSEDDRSFYNMESEAQRRGRRCDMTCTEIGTALREIWSDSRQALTGTTHAKVATAGLLAVTGALALYALTLPLTKSASKTDSHLIDERVAVARFWCAPSRREIQQKRREKSRDLER